MDILAGGKEFFKRNWALLVWAVAAFLFAVSRVPYDDEWFSLTLAGGTEWANFWNSLRTDFHPPGVALLDRAMFIIGLGRWGIHGLRVLVSLFSLFLMREVLEKRTEIGVKSWWILAAAFHPIVFYYSGAARWYPFVFLAQALRCWALFGPEAEVEAETQEKTLKQKVAFFVGAVVGPATGYLDFWFLFVDSGWWIHGAWRKGRVWRGLGVVFLSWLPGLLVVGLFAAPLIVSSKKATIIIFSNVPRFPVSWLGLGLLGEAHLPIPWILLFMVAVPGFVLALWKLFFRGKDWAAWCGVLSKRPVSKRTSLDRSFSIWFGVVVFSWLAGTLVMIWHPRYSLLVWVVAAVSLGGLFKDKESRLWRAAGLATLGYLALVLGLTVSGAGFVKGDLNVISTDHCEDLIFQDVDLVVAPYPRVASFLRRCPDAPPIETAPIIRHFPREREQMASLRGPINAAERILLITLVNPSSSLKWTQHRVRALIGRRCVLREARHAVEDVHWRLKKLYGSKTSRLRLQIQVWVCGDGSE